MDDNLPDAQSNSDTPASARVPVRSSIKDWSADDQPREKLLTRGKNALTDAELLAIIIGKGSVGESAVALMQRILKDCDDNLNILGRYSVDDLMRYKGIGEAKAIAIVAMLELGRRRGTSKFIDRPKVTCSKEAYDLIASDLIDLHHETFWVMMLNNGNRLIKKELISTGGMGSVLVDPKVIFKKALDNRAAAIILVHNHPSGNNYPSQQDISLTSKLVAAGNILEIKVADHIIIAANQYYSFADEGEI